MHKKQFAYVDFYAHCPATGRRTQWTRVHESRVQKMCDDHKGWEQFITIQRFSQPSHQKGELQYSPIFFDLDNEDLEVAYKDARDVLDFFHDLGVEDEYVRIWFSGKKGFHITVEPECFGYSPHPELYRKVRSASRDVSNYLSLSSFDDTVYSSRRMWRLADSKHGGTGLYCVELTRGEMVGTVEDIRAIAGEPRHENFESENVADPDHKDWWYEYEKEYQNIRDVERLQPKGDIKALTDGSDPACVKDFIENGMKKPGSRNSVLLALATWYWKKGTPIKETIEILSEWSKQQRAPMTDVPERQKLANVISVTRSLYGKSHDDWKFACHFMRSLGGDAANCVACDWESCQFVKQEEQAPAKRAEISLHEAIEPKYEGVPSSSEVYVVGVSKAPFLVPQRVNFRCRPNLDRDNSVCNFCKHASRPEDEKGYVAGEIVLGSKQDTLIEFCNVNKKRQKGICKTLFEVPENCQRSWFEPQGKVAINEVLAQPNIQYSEEFQDDKKGYRTNTFFHMGNELGPNKRYRINYVTHPNPNTQQAVHLSDFSTPIQSDYERFTMTPEIKDQLSMFQVRDDQTIKEKWDDIQFCMEANVHNMWGRSEVASAVDLTFHSASSFFFRGKRVDRGWLEICLFGDSGQGKSEIPKSLVKYYRRGEIVGCEQASEAGLIGGCDTTNGIISWGALPRNDMGMVILDECHSMSGDVLGTLTDIRDSGFASINKIIKGEAPARNRKIFIANPPYRDAVMSENQFGIVVLNQIFPRPEDVRRLDFAIAVTRTDIDPEIINQTAAPYVDFIYDSTSCQLLLDWVWSRKADQIKFRAGVEEYIMKMATRMSNTYDDTIPLVDVGTVRLKIARMAIACAARLFSTDTGENIVINKAHVDWCIDYMTGHYEASAMNYREFSKEAIKYRQWADGEFEYCLSAFKTSITNLKSFMNALSIHHVFKPADIEYEWEDSDRDLMKRAMSLLRRYHLIKPADGKGRYKRSAKFGKLFKAIQSTTSDTLPQYVEGDDFFPKKYD